MSATDQVGRQVRDAAADLRETVNARVVFGDPVERDGVTVIPAARASGGFGGGGGGGADGDNEGSGMGLGFGLGARPVGAFVIRDGNVCWKPAIDVTRIIVVGCLVAIAFFLSVIGVRRAEARSTRCRLCRRGRR